MNTIQKSIKFNTPPCHQNLKNLAHQEGQILLAISAIKNHENSLSICKAAHLYDVPFSTLKDQLHSTVARTNIHANRHKLTDTKEDTLLQ